MLCLWLFNEKEATVISPFRDPNLNENQTAQRMNAWQPYIVNELQQAQTADEQRATLDGKFLYAQLRAETDGGVQMKTRLRYTQCKFWQMLAEWRSLVDTKDLRIRSFTLTVS